MADVVFKVNHEGFNELLNSPAVVSFTNGIANEIRNRAGDGHKVYQLRMNKGRLSSAPRYAFVVRANTNRAKLAEAEHKNLTKAVYSCQF